MDNQEAIRVATLVLLVLGSLGVVAVIVTILQVRKLAREAEFALKEMHGDLSATMLQTRTTLERVERMAQGMDVMVREQVSPSIDSARWAFAKAQQSVQDLSAGASTMQRVVKAVQTVSGAGMMAALSSKALRRPGGIGLIALAAGAVVQALLRNSERKHQQVEAAGEELPAAISERSKPKGKDGHGVKTNGR